MVNLVISDKYYYRITTNPTSFASPSPGRVFAPAPGRLLHRAGLPATLRTAEHYSYPHFWQSAACSLGGSAAGCHLHRMSHYVPNLDAYCARIGYTGSREPTLETLHALSYAHVTSIPFENLDVLLGRGIDLDPAAVERKLVHDHRGGYCFEQNSLFLHVLTTLGYQVTPISARVRWQRARDFTPPRTHLFLRVEIDGASWLADVGVGNLSLTSALPLDDSGRELTTAHEPRRLVRERGRLFHQVRFGAEWHDVCEFTLEEMPPIDRDLANWYTSTHPASNFRARLVVSRATTEGRMSILNHEFTRRDRAGQAQTRVMANGVELLTVLREHFGLHFPPDTRFGPSGSPWPV